MENWEDKIWKRSNWLAQAAHQRGDVPFTIFQEAAEFGPVYIIFDTTYYRRKKNCRENKKTANIDKAVTFFLEEIE